MFALDVGLIFLQQFCVRQLVSHTLKITLGLEMLSKKKQNTTSFCMFSNDRMLSKKKIFTNLTE